MKMMMLVVLMSTAITANAQLKFGLKGGLNVSSMSFDKDVFESSNRTGFFLGPTLRFNLPVVGLGFDLSALYNQRKSEISASSSASGEAETLKTKSIEVPLNVRYGIGLSSIANIFFFAGPQVGFNVGDKEHKLTSNSTWTLSDSNFSVNLGAGVTLLSHLQLSANYNIACGKTGDVTFSDAVSSITKSSGRSNSWQIGLAYYF